MSVNKFGGSLNRAHGDKGSIEVLRSYVRNSALCLNPDHYDAKKRKIVRVAAPNLDTDATNKGYVDGAFIDRDKAFSVVRNNVKEVRENVDELTKSMNSLLQSKLEILSKNVDSLQTSQRETEKISTRLQQEEERLSRSIDELTRTSVRIESSLEDLKQQIRDTAANKKTLEKTIEGVKNTLESTANRTIRDTTLNKGELERFDIILRKFEEASTNTRNDVTELLKNVGGLSTTIVRIELSLENLKQEVRDTTVKKETLATLEKTIADLEKTMNEKIDKRAKELRERFDKALKSISSIITDDEILGQSFHSLHSLHQRVNENIKRINDGVENMVTKSTFNSAIANLKSAVDRLERIPTRTIGPPIRKVLPERHHREVVEEQREYAQEPREDSDS